MVFMSLGRGFPGRDSRQGQTPTREFSGRDRWRAFEAPERAILFGASGFSGRDSAAPKGSNGTGLDVASVCLEDQKPPRSPGRTLNFFEDG